MALNLTGRRWRPFYCLSILFAASFTIFGQELDPSILPPIMRDGVAPPDHVLYGAFLRHEATFERHARENEARELSGDAYRNHFLLAFGVTPAEQTQIAEIALSYYTQWSSLREQAKTAARDFRELNFPHNQHAQGTPLPSNSPQLVSISKQMRAATLASRDQIRAALGDERFAC